MSDKVAGIPKAAVLGDLLYALPGGAQQYFCMVDAVNRQIAVRCRPHDTPEGADKIIFGQRPCAQHIIDGNRLRIVRTDVLHRRSHGGIVRAIVCIGINSGGRQQVEQPMDLRRKLHTVCHSPAAFLCQNSLKQLCKALCILHRNGRYPGRVQYRQHGTGRHTLKMYPVEIPRRELCIIFMVTAAINDRTASRRQGKLRVLCDKAATAAYCVQQQMTFVPPAFH